MYRRRKEGLAILLAGLSLTVMLVLLSVAGLDGPAHADPAARYVALSGQDDGDCTDPTAPCRTLQYAVDAADPMDVVKVAAGVYDEVNTHGGLAQVLYLSKTLTIRGGYTTGNDFVDPPDPAANPTTLDAGGQGRGMYITGAISATLDGLRITGGNATGLGGTGYNDAGGGIYVYAATATISGCVILSNAATAGHSGYGGGLFLWNSEATLQANTIQGNTAASTDQGHGGGLCLWNSEATLQGNTVQGNTATGDYYGYGGGLFAGDSNVTLQSNGFLSNTAATNGGGEGGGLYLSDSDATLQGNTIQGNTGSPGDYGRGGGLSLILSNATLEGNTIQGNIAGTFREGHGGGLVSNGTNLILRGNTIAGNTACAGICTDYGAGGGGLYVLGGQATLEGNHIVGNTGCTRSWAFGGGLQLANCDAILRANTIAGNAASTGGSGHGGGLSLTGSQVVLQANTIISNTATFDHADTGRGGGLYIRDCSSLSLTNNVVATNQANTEGSGLWVQGPTVADPAPGRLRHTTIADNAGSGQGVFLAPDTLLVFENTIIAGHSVGLVASAGSEATLEATLWYENQALTAGEGTILTGTINVYEDPAFVDPLAGDYHLGPGSAAIDAGVDAGVDDDIDGDSRPQGAGYDLGADEFLVCVAGVSIAGPATAITGPAFPFTATVTPANAALPIVYTWSPEPEGGQGTVQAIYRWVNTGSLTITVEASNSCGAATASHTVDVGLAQLRYLPLYLRHYSLSGNLLLVHLDEPSGATCFVDSSGVNEPLCCAGSSCPMAGVEGKRNAAAHFDGTDDYLGLGDKSSLNIIGEITMEAWVKVAAADGIRNIVAHGLTTTPPGEVFLRVMDDSYQVGSWDGGLSHRANYPIQDGDMGSWVFLAGVYDGQAWRLYRNGVEVSSLIASTGAVLVEDYWAIGASGNGNERFFQGSIDEVAIYGRALSPEEILEHYQQGLAGLIP